MRKKQIRAETVSVLRCVSALGLLLVVLGCASTRDYLRDADAVNEDLTIHVVIENPAGTNEKWEVRANGRLVREVDLSGRPREIQYLPWPFNAGMVPRTLLSAEMGGDNEPCDVLVLGPTIPRGSLVRAIPIGILRMVDRLERDDKILAVVPGTPLGEVSGIEDLETRFPGVGQILESWYTHSGRFGDIQVERFGSRAAAARLLGECSRVFEALEAAQALPTWGEQ